MVAGPVRPEEMRTLALDGQRHIIAQLHVGQADILAGDRQPVLEPPIYDRTFSEPFDELHRGGGVALPVLGHTNMLWTKADLDIVGGKSIARNLRLHDRSVTKLDLRGAIT